MDAGVGCAADTTRTQTVRFMYGSWTVRGDHTSPRQDWRDARSPRHSRGAPAYSLGPASEGGMAVTDLAMGVNITGDTAWLTVVDTAGVAVAEPDRLTLTRSTDRATSLLECIQEIRALLRETSVVTVGILDAHGSYNPRSIQGARPRIVLEVLWEIAGAKNDVPVAVVSPATIQSALGLASKRVGDHVDTCVKKAGTKWKERGPGALAGLTMLRSIHGTPR
jgi:hypothetical protein